MDGPERYEFVAPGSTIDVVTAAMPIVFRPARPTDSNYVLATWKKSQRRVGAHGDMMNAKYYAYIEGWITSVLSDAFVTVACDETEPWMIYGYAVYSRAEPRVLHYLFVKPAYRNMGVGTRLLDAIGRGAEMVCTARSERDWPHLSERLKLRYEPGWKGERKT